MARVRILFSSDFHGNEVVWRKFLNSATIFKVDVLLMGGDMTGKVLLPIVKTDDGRYESYFQRRNQVLTEEQLPELKKKAANHSLIPYVCSKEEYEELNRSHEFVEKVFERAECESIREWCDLIPQKVPNNVKVIIHSGNDDKFAIDEVLKGQPSVIFAEEDVIDLDGEHEAACCSWANPTPWNSPRECSEEELEQKLESIISKIRSMNTGLFCFHVPPYGSGIDSAPLLDKEFRPIYEQGRPVYVPVGSKAVRKMIVKYQPLLGLHGHIHESPGMYKIGRTQCLNPGSEYGEGLLKAFILELEGTKIVRQQRMEG